jgi:hypothetical protein
VNIRLLTRVFLILAIVTGVQLVYFGEVDAQSSGNTYTTTFPATENPISEGGKWINGQAVGLDWQNVRTKPGLAYGADASGTPNYNDPTALLTGTWGPDQTVEATVYSVNQQVGNVTEEVEIRLRSTITAHVNKGYEVLFRCTHDGTQYTEIVRWNGPLGNWTYVKQLSGSAAGPGIRNGDVVKATIVGSVITGYINNVQVIQASDSTHTTGNPGMGFYMNRVANANADYGFTRFSAWDSGGGTIPPPGAPSNVRILQALLRGSIGAVPYAGTSAGPFALLSVVP